MGITKTRWIWGTALSIFIVTPAMAATTREVYNTARATSIKIESQNSGAARQGSGFLVKKQGNIYSLVTSKHVTKCLEAVCQYTLTAADGQSYIVSGKNIQVAADLDLAVIKFSSPRNYQIASLATSKIEVNETVYTSGFPVAVPGFRFAGGDTIANANRRLVGDKGGYTTVYNAHTNSGMSGGAVFNQKGQVVAIHGHGDRNTSGTTWVDPALRASNKTKEKLAELIGQKTGYNRGVAINWLRGSELGASIWGKRTTNARAVNAQSADEFLILGINKFINADEQNIQQEKRQAIEYFSRAIQLQPNYGYAYAMRSTALFQLNEMAAGMADTQKYLGLIAPSFGDFIPEKQLDTWLTDKQNFAQASKLMTQVNVQMASPTVETLKLLDRAIQLIPKNSDILSVNFQLTSAYQLRGAIEQKQGNTARSIADYRQSVKFYPIDNPASYLGRGDIHRYFLQDNAAALADYRRALQLAQQQSDRETIKSAQFSISSLSSTNSNTGGRGFDSTTLGNNRSTRNSRVSFLSILPRNRQIQRNPDLRDAEDYIRRSYAGYQLGRPKRSLENMSIIKDLRAAAKLYQQANEPQKAALVMQVVRKLEADGW